MSKTVALARPCYWHQRQTVLTLPVETDANLKLRFMRASAPGEISTCRGGDAERDIIAGVAIQAVVTGAA